MYRSTLLLADKRYERSITCRWNRRIIMTRKVRIIIPVITYRLSVLTVCKSTKHYICDLLSNRYIPIRIKIVVVIELSTVRQSVGKKVEMENASVKKSIK